MFSLLCEGETLPPDCVTFGAKYGETPESALSAGDRLGGLLEPGDVLSARIHGPAGLCSEMAERTGDRALGDAFFASCLPSAWKNGVFFGSCFDSTSLA